MFDKINLIKTEQSINNFVFNNNIIFIESHNVSIILNRDVNGDFYIENMDQVEYSRFVINNIGRFLDQIKFIGDIRDFISDYSHIIKK